MIVFEGIECCGKTTQVGLLKRHIEEELGREVLVVREPGGTKVGEVVRHLVKHDPAGQGMHSLTELLLFAASRAQLVHEVIVPALTAGKIVICDRFVDSTTAYQGHGRGIKLDIVDHVNMVAVGCYPYYIVDLTLILDLPVKESFRRLSLRNPGALPDRMEAEKMEFYDRVRFGYLGMDTCDTPRRIIDATRSVEDVHANVKRHMAALLNIEPGPNLTSK